MVQQMPVGGNRPTQDQLVVLETSHQLVLSKSAHLAGVLQMPSRQVDAAWNDLLASGRLASGLRDRSTIWSPNHTYVTKTGLGELAVDGPTWHEEANRCMLLPRFPLIDPFYRITAALVPRLGAFREFQWLADAGLDAATTYDRGWAGLMWSGAFESSIHFQQRLESQWLRLTRLATTTERPVPAVIVVVAQDEWQKELATNVASRLFLPSGFLQIWCPKDGDWPGMDDILRSRGEISQPILRRDLGGWPWQTRVAQAIYAMPGRAIKVMELIAEWRELSMPWIKAALGEGKTGRATQGALDELLEAELIERRGTPRQYMYSPTGRAMDQLRLRDGIGARDSKGDADRERQRLLRHETGLKQMILHFITAGLKTACGIRSWEDLGKEGGGISPDALVLLINSPFGAGWVYVEYELSARGPRLVEKKLRGYGSDLRRDDYPVLVVCATDRAERNFHAVGRERGIRMLTTTVARLRQHGPLGNQECWSHYGEMVQIG